MGNSHKRDKIDKLNVHELIDVGRLLFPIKTKEKPKSTTGIIRKYIVREQSKIGKKKIHNSSGCSFDLSVADFNDFEQQRKDATEFLKNQYDKLKLVYSFGLDYDENPIIDFGTTTRMHEVEIQCDYLEPELLKLSGNLNFGIEISQYHPALEEDES